MSIVSMDVRQMRRHWDALARRDPLWAVLTDPDKKDNRWRLDEFFETGRREVATLMEQAAHLGLRVRGGRALDFGCGVGRLTQALAEHFEQVVGVDISPAMIERASALNRKGARCEYRVNAADDLSAFRDGAFDLVLSVITLQHMEPVFIRRYLREFARVLAPGGVLVFQLPSERVAGEAAAQPSRVGGWGVRPLLSGTYYKALEWVRQLKQAVLFRWWLRQGRPVIQMHGLPRAEVEAALVQAGVNVVDVVEDASAAPVWKGYRYWGIKERTP